MKDRLEEANLLIKKMTQAFGMIRNLRKDPSDIELIDSNLMFWHRVGIKYLNKLQKELYGVKMSKQEYLQIEKQLKTQDVPFNTMTSDETRLFIEQILFNIRKTI